MILAAGRGERLRPLTDTVPKPLIQVGNYRLIEYHLFALVEGGFRQVVINVSHLGQQIVDFLGDGTRYGLEISYSWEQQGALETAGGIHHALDLLNSEQFLVVNADIFCNLDFSILRLPASMAMHLVLINNPGHNPDGDFTLQQSANGIVAAKPADGVKSYTFSGIGLYRATVFRDLISGKQPLLPLFHHYIDQTEVSAEVFNGLWIDVGTRERLEQARLAAMNYSTTTRLSH